ncbi:class I SAM-dependent methyltransferase [Nesterenkonia sp.]|uniref:class I SAM-dependent methyltransferase n=1 Tax=Nesterenkonia sp. TaxID=704201 RepID=UPI00260FAE3D|nr:class I SAM-dependent methyltransferase [Nesterenkonia sp.]
MEPDERLLRAARARPGAARVLHGSAEHIPLPDASVDVVHARFAYFFPSEGFSPQPGLDEVARVLRPGGRLVVIDNDHEVGEFAQLLAASAPAAAQGRGSSPTRWWAERGAQTVSVLSGWQFQSRRDSSGCCTWSSPRSWHRGGWMSIRGGWA